MYDEYGLGTHFKQPTKLCGRFAGAGASVPTPVALNPDAQATRCTITRNAAGNLNVQFLDTPLGIVQNYDFWVCSNNAADSNVRVTPPTAGSYNFRLNIVFAANGTARDVAVGEELCFEITTSRSGTP